MRDKNDSIQVDTVICCEGCDAPVVRIPSVELQYIDPAGVVTARCFRCEDSWASGAIA